jgi:hypothetical protein
MAQERIDSIIDVAAIEGEIKFLNDNLGQIEGKISSFGKIITNLNGAKGFKDISDSSKALNSETEATISLQKKRVAVFEEVLKMQNRLNGSTKETLQNTKLYYDQMASELKVRKEQANAIQAEEKAKDRLNAQSEKEKKLTDQVTNDYFQLNKAYNDAALKAKNYFLTLGENHPVTIAAVKDASDMHKVLLKVDQAVGQNQRNVGNYKSAFDGLRVSFSQVSRELPSLTVSAQQFFLAISNNLPMVADEIAKAKVEIAALKAEGKDTPSLFQRIGASIFSWQVGLSIAITLLTAFGAVLVKWIKGLFDGSEALKEAAKQQEELNQRTEQGSEILRKYYELRNQNFGTVNRDLQNQLAYAKAFGKSEDEILKIEQKLLAQRQLMSTQEFFAQDGLQKLGDLGKALKKAQEQLTEFLQTGQGLDGKELKFGSEDFKERETQLRSTFEVQTRLYNEQKAIVEEYYDSNKDAATKDKEFEAFIASEKRKLMLESAKIESDIIISTNDNILRQDKSTLDQRIASLHALDAAKKRIAEAELNDIVNDPGSTETKKLIAEKSFNKELYTITLSTNKALFDVKEEYRKRDLKAQLDALKAQTDIDISGNDKIIGKEKAGFDQRLLALYDNYEKRRHIIVESYKLELDNANLTAKEREAIETKYLSEINQLNTDFGQKQVEIEKANQEKINEVVQAAIKQRYATIAEGQGEAVKQLNEAFRSGNIGVNQYNQERAEIEKKFRVQALQADIAGIYNKLFQAKKGSQEEFELKKQLAEKAQALDDETTTKSIENAKKLKDAKKAFAHEAFDAIKAVVLAQYDAEKNKIQDQIDLVDVRTQKEIEAINQLVISEQDKAARVALIQARAAAEKNSLEKKQRQLEVERARFEKAANIARIIGDTAVAVVEALGSRPFTPANIALATVVGAIGAAQLAAAIATPVPRFEGGVKSSPEGFALTDEKGAEGYITPGGKMFIGSNNGPTLRYLARGTEVIPHHELMARIVNKSLPQYSTSSSNNGIAWNSNVADKLDDIEKAIKGKKSNLSVNNEINISWWQDKQQHIFK